MQPEGITRDELDNLCQEHLPYELAMLGDAARVLSETDDAAKPTYERCRTIECFYIHLRCLDAFFYDRGGKGRRDARAVDFFDDPQRWRINRPRRSREMSRAVADAGTLVVHLSYDRQSVIEAGRGLDWLNLSRQMKRVYEAFQRSLEAIGRRIPLAQDFSLVPPGTSEVKYTSANTVSVTTMSAFFPSAKARAPEEA